MQSREEGVDALSLQMASERALVSGILIDSTETRFLDLVFDLALPPRLGRSSIRNDLGQ